MAVRHVFVWLLAVLLLSLSVSAASGQNQCEYSRYIFKPRVFVLSDISNEPDDQMSLLRLLVYANELDIQGIAAVTSTYLKNTTDEATIRTVIGAYGNITENLNNNVPSKAHYPASEEFLAKVYKGHSVYGLESLKLNTSDAGMALVRAVDNSERPLWVTIWGGAAVLAEALYRVENTRSANDTAAFVEKLRVYSISDQDDAGTWIRERFPALFFIVSIHGFSEFSQATWSGISGEELRRFDKGGPNTSLVTNDWLQQNIRIGELGAYYPNYTAIMEGDTPSFLPLIQNGLGDPDHPEWGSWGGRYKLIDSSGRAQTFANTADFVYGMSGDAYYSSFATIWRWRKAYQYDFAARMQWSANGKFADNNHPPVVVINDTCGPSAFEVAYTPGNSIVLDLSESWDPDDDDLKFRWFTYRDVAVSLDGPLPDILPNVTVTNLNENGSVVRVTPPEMGSIFSGETMHLILSVEDSKGMALTTYRRIILKAMA